MARHPPPLSLLVEFYVALSESAASEFYVASESRVALSQSAASEFRVYITLTESAAASELCGTHW